MSTRPRPALHRSGELLRQAEELSQSADARLSEVKAGFFNIDPITNKLKSATDNIVSATRDMYQSAHIVHSGPAFRALAREISRAETLRDAAKVKEEAVSQFRTKVLVGFVPGVGMVAVPVGKAIGPTFHSNPALIIG